MENVIVVIIVALAVIYLVRRFTRIFHPKAENACGCGCGGCDQMATCNSEMQTIQRKHDR